jgi:hypothetical protein
VTEQRHAGRQAGTCLQQNKDGEVSEPEAALARLSFHLEGAREVFFWARGIAFAQEFYTSAKVNEKRQLIPCEQFMRTQRLSLAADVPHLNAFLFFVRPFKALKRIMKSDNLHAFMSRNYLTIFNTMQTTHIS